MNKLSLIHTFHPWFPSTVDKLERCQSENLLNQSRKDDIKEQGLPKTHEESKIEGIIVSYCLILDVLSISIEKWTKQQVGERLEKEMKLSHTHNLENFQKFELTRQDISFLSIFGGTRTGKTRTSLQIG